VLFGSDPRLASPEALRVVAGEVPATTLLEGEVLPDGVDLVPVLVRTGLASSQGDARRQLEQRGLAVNGEKVEPGRHLGPDDLLAGRWVLLRKGKKEWAVLDAGRTS
jgi:tyrosyl-tRNA synthetase